MIYDINRISIHLFYYLRKQEVAFGLQGDDSSDAPLQEAQGLARALRPGKGVVEQARKHTCLRVFFSSLEKSLVVEIVVDWMVFVPLTSSSTKKHTFISIL